MGIVLPTSRVAPSHKSPTNLIIFSKPKIGKTSLLSTLDNCLILDLEGGSKYLNAMKVEAKTFEEIREIHNCKLEWQRVEDPHRHCN